MGTCAFRYREPHQACRHGTVEGAELCLWHDPRVRKDDAYLPTLLEAADRIADGDLDGFHLVGLHWPEASLAGRSLRCADLRDAVLDVADLSGADLAGANLRRASLKRANLQRACLAQADLSACNLTGADLREADLKYAVLSRTVLNGADLRGADLTEAKIEGFLWNAASRFQGIRGVSEPVLAGEDDETRACLSPMAAGSLAPVDEGDRSALEDIDPAKEETRSFAVLRPVPKPRRAALSGRERGLLLTACLAIVAAAGGLAFGLTPRDGGTTPHPVAVLPTPSTDAAQVAAFQERLHQVEADLSRAVGERDRLAQQTLIAQAETQRLDTLLRQARADAAGLRAAEDHARLADDRLAALSAERDRALADLARQRRIGAILADGARSLEETGTAQARRIAELSATADRAELLARELASARDELRTCTAAREAAESRLATLQADLTAVRQDLERYLGRVTGTSWQDLLADAASRSDAIPVRAGRPIALGGPYAVTLRVDHAERPGHVSVAVTVQRETGAGDPDVAIVLFDREGRALRRLAFSFADTGEGNGITAARSEIACQTFPTSVRVLIAPSVDVARR